MEYPYLYFYTVHGYQKEEPSNTFLDACSIHVYAENEEEALSKAKKIIKKNYYRIAGAREEIDSIRANYLNVKEQTNVQKELVNVFKKDWEK